MDKKEPLVSVIMPAYNAEKFIGEAIDSILNQTFKDFEFIILDDCSTDKTWEIIQEYAKKDERIIAIKNEKNLNIALNRNKGVERSKGKYVVWQDADDISKPERIEKLFNYMENHSEVGICGSNFLSFSGDKLMGIREFFEEDELLRKNIFKFSPVAQPTAIVRKECFSVIGLFNPEYPTAEDIELSFRIGMKYKFGNVSEVLLMYREHPNSATHIGIRKQIDNTLKVRSFYLKSGYYRVGISDYVSYLITSIFRFLPASLIIKSFKIFRTIVFNVYSSFGRRYKYNSGNKKIIVIYHADYITGVDPNYSVTYGFLERFFPSQYKVIKHSLYNNGETRVYPDGVHGKYKTVPLIGKIPAPIRYFFETFFSIIYLIFRRPNVVISVNPLSSFAPCLLKSIHLIDKVYFINPDFSKERFENPILNKFYYLIDKFVTRHCTKNICNSTYVINFKKELYSDLNLEDKFFHMPNIPNPWVIETFKEMRKINNRVIYVGGLGTQLDFEKIIEIVYKLKKVSPDIHLVLVGEGSEKANLEEYVTRNKIDNVEFLGVLTHQDTLKEIAKSEFGIALYNGSLNYDKFRDSCKIREYQALSCIPITTNIVKSNFEEIKDNDSGIIVKNAVKMEGALSSLLINVERKKTLMENAFRNYELYVKKFDDFYKIITSGD